MAKGDWKNKGFGKAFAAGAIKGGTVGSVIPGLGTGVGALVGGIGGMLKQRKANKASEITEEVDVSKDQVAIDAEVLANEKLLAAQKEQERRQQISTVPGMKPAYGSPVFNPATQQTMGALSGANPGADPSLPYQGGENALLENALSGLYS